MTPEQIAAAKATYEAAVEAEKAAAKVLADIVNSHATVIKAYTDAKAAHDALKPAQTLAKAKLDRAAADVKIAYAEYKVADPSVAAKKGSSNNSLLMAVTKILTNNPGGVSNAGIYDALLAAGVEMGGSDPRANLNSYLSRWGSSGVVVSKGQGVWGLPATSVPSFIAPPPEMPTNPFANPAPSDELGDDFPGLEPLNEAGITTRSSLAGATLETLQQIPGIGAKTAAKILEVLAA